MRRTNKCPECGGFTTERVHTERYSDRIDDVFICESCEIEYVAHLVLDEREVTHRSESASD
jgi:hypothetical protein